MRTHAAIVSLLASGAALAGGLHTAPFGPGGTWNLYQLIDGSVTWNDAKRQAEKTRAPAGNPDAAGHLVTFSSIAENQFMRFVSNGQAAWCGLTDDERFGGNEAGSHPRNGWKWVTGEPLAFSRWKPNEPDDWTGEGKGEDAVFMDRYGNWSDTGIGDALQTSAFLPYIVEWETRAAKPVSGAVPLTAAWPADVVMPDLVPGKWNARWVSGYVRGNGSAYNRPRTIPEAAVLLAENRDGQKSLIQKKASASGRMPWLWLSTPDTNRQGWLPSNGVEGNNFPDLPPQSNYIGAVIGKIHVENAGTHTFAVTAEEAFALRIGGLKWKSASGDGYVDPLDPLTFTQPCGGLSSKALAVMDLPAGDHLVEALWMVETYGSEFHVLSAPGVHLTEGSTTDWRPLGHPMDSRKIAWLGITEAGWTVDCSMAPPPGSGSGIDLQDGLLKLELDLGRITKPGLASINFADAPETDPCHFPNAAVFPNHRPGTKNEHWPLRARARLIVPMDGIYDIGLHAAGSAALRVKGGEFNGFSQTAQGGKGLNLRGDSIDFDGQVNSNADPKIVSQWMLKKGEYDIDVFYAKNLGPAALAVFSCPSGPYAPGLLTVGGAGIRDDLPGLPHASR